MKDQTSYQQFEIINSSDPVLTSYTGPTKALILVNELMFEIAILSLHCSDEGTFSFEVTNEGITRKATTTVHVLSKYQFIIDLPIVYK